MINIDYMLTKYKQGFKVEFKQQVKRHVLMGLLIG